jgi:hypothetical protein
VKAIELLVTLFGYWFVGLVAGYFVVFVLLLGRF